MTEVKKNKLENDLNILFCVKNIDNGIIRFLNSIHRLNKKTGSFNIITIFYENSFYFKREFIKDKNFYQLSKNISTEESFQIKKIILFIFNLLNTVKFMLNKKPKLVIVIGLYCLVLTYFIEILNKFIFKHNLKIVFLLEINLVKLINSKPGTIYRKILHFIVGRSLKKIDYLISTSKENVLYLENYYKIKFKNFKIIPYGINIKKEGVKNSFSRIKKIISIGRFTNQKDFQSIVKGFKIYITNRKDKKAKLILVGDGPLKFKLKKTVDKLKLNKNVKFTRWVDNVFSYLKKADIFVFSSNYEGFGYVILEAMSQGLPVISTDTPFGPREILDNGKYGILVPMKDPEKMAEAIYQLLTNEKKYQYYSKKSLERVKDFSERKMLKRYKELFLTLINNKN